MPRARVDPAVSGLFIAIMLGGCSGSTAPHATSASIQVVAGGSQQDTIGTTLPQALVVRVAPPSRGTNAGQTVQFTAIQPTSPGGAIVYVSSLDVSAGLVAGRSSSLPAFRGADGGVCNGAISIGGCVSANNAGMTESFNTTVGTRDLPIPVSTHGEIGYTWAPVLWRIATDRSFECAKVGTGC